MKLDPLLQKRYLRKVQVQLMSRKRWAYLRYLHLRQGFQEALKQPGGDIKSFISIGCGSALAEIALALEFPETQFHVTDIGTLKELEQKLGIRMAQEWQIFNVSFDVHDILSKSFKTYDFVASVEVLEHIKDDTIAVKNMINMANKFVFALVPFASIEQNLDPQLRANAFRNHEHYRVGYNLSSLSILFPKISIIRNCYFEEIGFKFRQNLDLLTPEEITMNFASLQQFAEQDLGEKTMIKQETKNYGIWVLAQSQSPI